MRTRLFSALLAGVIGLTGIGLAPAAAAAATPAPASMVSVAPTVHLASKGTVYYVCRKYNWFFGWQQLVTRDYYGAVLAGYTCYECLYVP